MYVAKLECGHHKRFIHRPSFAIGNNVYCEECKEHRRWTEDAPVVEVQVIKVRPPRLWGKPYAVGVAKDGRVLKFTPYNAGELYDACTAAIQQGLLVDYGLEEDQVITVLGTVSPDWDYDIRDVTGLPGY